MKKTLVVLSAACSLFMNSASADVVQNFSYTGTLPDVNSFQTFQFVVGAPSSVTLRTWSYAGGTNAAGNLISQGGFDPILALFNASGARIGENDDGGCGFVAADSATGRCYDTYLRQSLSAGNYTVSVANFANFAGANINNPFSGEGQANFAGRTNAWAFDILGVQSAIQVGNVVPEPGSLALLGLGLISLTTVRRRKAI